MAFVAAAIGGSALVGGLLNYSSAQNAANTESQAANAANNLSASEFNTIQQENAPYRAAGTQALQQMQDPSFQKGFTAADFQESPGYQFSLQQGQNALNASQAAQGNNVSGAGLTALSQYNQGMANQQYQQAFNNFNTTQNQNYSRLSTLANLGTGANAQSGAAGQNYANQAGQNMMAGAGASAAGGIAQGNAINGSMSGLASAYGYSNAASNQHTQNFMNAEPGSAAEDKAAGQMFDDLG